MFLDRNTSAELAVYSMSLAAYIVGGTVANTSVLTLMLPQTVVHMSINPAC